MTRNHLWLFAFGLLDVTVVAYLIWSAIQTGNTLGPRGSGGRLVYRDRSPFLFWSSIASYAILGGLFLVLIGIGLSD